MESTHLVELQKLHHFLCAALLKFGHKSVIFDIALFSKGKRADKLFMTMESRKFHFGIFRSQECTLVTVPSELLNAPGVLAAIPKFRENSLIFVPSILSGAESIRIEPSKFIDDLESIIISGDPNYKQVQIKTIKTIKLQNTYHPI